MILRQHCFSQETDWGFSTEQLKSSVSVARVPVDIDDVDDTDAVDIDDVGDVLDVHDVDYEEDDD